MKLTTLRYLDKVVWVPTVLGFSIIKKLFRKERKIENLANLKPKKILLIKLWWIGSVVLMSPVVTNLRKMYPDAQIHFLTKKWVDVIYKEWVFDRIFTLNTGWILNAIKDFIFTPINLFRQRYDIIIDFEIVSYYTAALSFLVWPKYHIGYQIIGKLKDKLYDFNAIYHESKHITEIFISPLKLLGLNAKDVNYDLIPPYFSELDEKNIFNKFPNIKECIAINVNTSDLALERRWWTSQYIEIINYLNSKNIEVLLVWSPDERKYVDKIYSWVQNKNLTKNIAWEITLWETFALLKNVKLFITNDSWPLHIAVAYKTPTISFFWPETPIIYWPKYKKELHKVFFLNLFCSPCISVFRDKNFICKNDNGCMKNISSREVIDYINKVL